MEPALAERLASGFHEGIVQGAADPQGISNVLWSLAFLGYAPPTHMLDDLQVLDVCQNACCDCTLATPDTALLA